MKSGKSSRKLLVQKEYSRFISSSFVKKLHQPSSLWCTRCLKIKYLPWIIDSLEESYASHGSLNPFSFSPIFAILRLPTFTFITTISSLDIRRHTYNIKYINRTFYDIYISRLIYVTELINFNSYVCEMIPL